MNKPLLVRLGLLVVGGTLALFSTMNFLSYRAEEEMSFIAPEHQRGLLEYAARLDKLWRAGDAKQLERAIEYIQRREKTWAALVTADLSTHAGTQLIEEYREDFRLGRRVDWKIHLYFAENPVLDMPIGDGDVHFLIRLPERMRPGGNRQFIGILLRLVLPLCLLGAMTALIYRHIMRPLRNLELATRKLALGDFDVAVRPALGKRNDELAALAENFDHMTRRLGLMMVRQRHLLADLSHELRTPLARLELAIEGFAQGADGGKLHERVARETAQMRQLVEDTLTLARLDDEQPEFTAEPVALGDLLAAIATDVEYEFPCRQIHLVTPPEVFPIMSSPRALGQAFENIIRNAMRHSPPGGDVFVEVDPLEPPAAGYKISVRDQGPGVDESLLEAIFKPFFRTEQEPDAGGFGLGLALARRQLEAVGGSVRAYNGEESGLVVAAEVPDSGAAPAQSATITQLRP